MRLFMMTPFISNKISRRAYVGILTDLWGAKPRPSRETRLTLLMGLGGGTIALVGGLILGVEEPAGLIMVSLGGALGGQA
jgi:hypothetical protein